MMWKEFEEIAGYEVSYDTYTNIVEPMYMAIPDNMTKQQFVKLLNRKAIEKRSVKAIVKEMKPLAESLKNTCDHYTDRETKEKLDALIDELNANADYDVRFTIYTKTTLPDYRGCSFPAYLVKYNQFTYEEYDRITLCKPWYEQ